MEKKDFFVAIPNKMFAFETDLFVSDDEFLLFYHLGTIVQARNKMLVIVNIDLLSSMLNRIDTNTSRVKNKVKIALLGLETKGYISIKYYDTKLNNSTLLYITLVDKKHSIYVKDVKCGSWKYVGFTMVTEEMFNKTSNARELKVLTYILWRSTIEYSISYYEWEKILGVSHATAVNIIKECQSKGSIVKQRGDYYTTACGDIRQETNRYSIKETEDVKENKISLLKEINTITKSMSAEDSSNEERPNKWFYTGDESKLDVDDMYIYLTTNCPVLKKHADKRINGLIKTPTGRAVFDNLKQKAEERLKLEQNKVKGTTTLTEEEKEMILSLNSDKVHVFRKQETPYPNYLPDDELTITEEDEFPMFP